MGYLKDMSFKQSLGTRNVLELETANKVPDWWGGTETSNPRKNKTELKEQRKQARLPDISYDLDGDGYVGNKDFVIAKCFDKDNDGRLNTHER